MLGGHGQIFAPAISAYTPSMAKMATSSIRADGKIVNFGTTTIHGGRAHGYAYAVMFILIKRLLNYDRLFAQI